MTADKQFPISLRLHTNYLLDTSDRVVRYHYSFIFLFLNIWLRRMAHLHTHLVVLRMNIDWAGGVYRSSNERVVVETIGSSAR